jgi:hypothetical protein
LQILAAPALFQRKRYGLFRNVDAMGSSAPYQQPNMAE